MYFRQQSNGSILALSSVDSSVTEFERSTEYARFVGMTLHQRTGVLYWSDGRSIKRRSVVSPAANSGSQTQTLVGILAHVTWYGVNFGRTESDIVELSIKGTPCVSVLSWSSETVECLVGLPLRYPSTAGDSVSMNAKFVRAEDCKIQTTSGVMQGAAPNFGEMRAAGYTSPIVERLDVRATFITPHALAVNDNVAADKTEEWLYWSNSADGKIYRSHLSSTRLEVVQENAWSVRGLALGRLSSDEKASSLYFSLESKGVIARILLPPSSQGVAGRAFAKREILLQGLESPRGIALDTVNQALYFAEKTGRIFRAKMLRNGIVSSATTAENDSKSGPLMAARKVVALATMTRLDGLAVDSKCVAGAIDAVD